MKPVTVKAAAKPAIGNMTERCSSSFWLASIVAMLLGLTLPMMVSANIAFRASSTASQSTGSGTGGGIRLVGTSYSENSGSSSGSVRPNLPSATQTGDLMICIIESRDNVIPSSDTSYASGWTLLYSISNGTTSQASLFYKIATSSNESDPRFIHSGGGIVARCTAFRGVDPINPFDTAYASANSGADNTVESGSLTTVSSNALLLFAEHMADNHQSATVSGQQNLSWSQALFTSSSTGAQGGEAVGMHYASKPSAGTVGSVITEVQYSSSSTPAVSTGVLIALRPAAATTGLTIPVPAGTAIGDIMIATLAVRPYNIPLGTPSGWTLVRAVQQTSYSSNKLVVYRKVVTGAEPASYTWTYAGSHSGLVGAISSFSGVDTVNPILAENGVATGLSLSHSTPSISPTTANAMLVASFAYSSATNWTPPTGMTEAADVASHSVNSGSGESMEVAYQIQANAGATGVKTASAATNSSTYSDRGATVLLALKPLSTLTLDHIQINHDGSGTICAREPVTVQACADTRCTTAYPGPVSVTLSPSGWWNVLTGGTPSDNVSFSGGSGLFYLSNTTAGAVTLGASSIQPVPGGTPSFNCMVGNTQTCTLNFASSGLKFSNIPPQSAGVPSGTVTLQAFSGADGGVCSGITGLNTIDLAMQCIDPSTCANQQVSINGNAIASNPASGVAQWTPVALDFGTSSTASFSLNYPDVGKLQLMARYSSGSSIVGNSNAFVVRPYAFGFTNIRRTADNFANPAASDANGTVFIKAGDPFSVTVTAIANGGAATPNFGHEISPEAVQLSQSLVAPAGGNVGTLSGTTLVASSSFSNGTASPVTNLSWNDVGIISLSAAIADGDYLGAGNVTSTSGNIGRFIPHHFTTDATPACPSVTEAPPLHFTYSGQAFTDATVNAQDSNGGTPQNYDGNSGFAKTVTLSDAGTTTAFANNTLTTEFTDGVGTSTALTYTSPINAPAPRKLTLRASGTDGVSTASWPEITPWIYSGRLYAGNATGSELLALAVPLVAQYYDGANWVTNTEDYCTPLSAGNISLSNYTQNLGSGVTASTIANNPLLSGDAGLTLSAPGSGHAGSTTLTVTTPSYLRFDWNGDGIADDASSIILFTGSTPAGRTVIDTRENF